MYTLRTRFFARFGADLYAQSVIINRISASELSWKFIESALLVGQALCFFCLGISTPTPTYQHNSSPGGCSGAGSLSLPASLSPPLEGIICKSIPKSRPPLPFSHKKVSLPPPPPKKTAFDACSAMTARKIVQLLPSLPPEIL